MPEYSNGYIPGSLLVTFNVGYSTGEGLWKHQLSPGTYSKHLALVKLARKNTGRTLALSAGWSGYRPYSAQVYAQQRYGRGAATPGTSSHGGFWERRQTLAIDYGNWAYVYGGDRAAFYRDVRAVGLVPGLISVPRGYPDEPWHVVDLDPWAAVPAGSGSAFVPEEDDMTPEQAKQLNSLFDAMFNGGNSMKDGKRSISQSLAEIHEKVGPIYRTGGSETSLRQEIANINGKVTKLQATQSGLEAALTALANAKGLDASAILKAAQQGVENALRKVTFTADVDG